MSAETTPNAKPASALTIARDVAAVAAIYLFFAGFVYTFYYADRLGIPRSADAPAYAILSSAWTVINLNLWWDGLAVILLIGAATLSSRLLREDKPKPHVVSAVVAMWSVLALCAFPLIFIAARDTGRYVALQTLQGKWLRQTHFIFDAKVKSYYPGVEDANKRGELRLVATTGKAVYVMQVSSDPTVASTVFAVKWELVDSYYTILN